MTDVSIALHSVVTNYLVSMVAHFKENGMSASLDKGLSLVVKCGAIKYRVWAQLSRSGQVFRSGDVYVHKLSFALFREWHPVLSTIPLSQELSTVCEVVSACPVLEGEDVARCVEGLCLYDLSKLTKFMSEKSVEMTRVIHGD